MSHSITTMRQAHKVLAKLKYQPADLDKGFANRWLRIDLTNNKIEIRPIDEETKRLFTGGKGIDLWLTFQEVTKDTKWDSPENPLVMGCGALGGTSSFPGAGKTLVTAISPTTGSMMDCNVGGYFGPYLKFSGFDHLMLIGKATAETIVIIDGTAREIRIERAPKEAIDSHVLAEQLTEMYADNEYERRNISVVSAGEAADHTMIGMLNFSFWDWRRRAIRLKQAGRGGTGTVFRNKKVKALVVKTMDVTPSWSIQPNKAAKFTELPKPGQVKKVPCTGHKIARDAAAKFKNDSKFIFDLMREVQAKDGFLSQPAVETLNVLTGIPKGKIYAWASFHPEFSLAPRGAKMIQVCACTACHQAGSSAVLKAFEKALKIGAGKSTKDLKWTLVSAPEMGHCLNGPVVKVGDQMFDSMTAKEATTFVKTAKTLGLKKSACVGKGFRLNGAVARPNVVDSPVGATIEELVNNYGGGVAPGKLVKAYQAGGIAGAYIPAEDKLTTLGVDAGMSSVFGPTKGMPGLTVIDTDQSMAELAANAIHHLSKLSCGKCTACREGLFAMDNVFAKLKKGEGTKDDIAFLADVAETVQVTSQCQFGIRAANPVLSALKFWPEDFEAFLGEQNSNNVGADAPAGH